MRIKVSSSGAMSRSLVQIAALECSHMNCVSLAVWTTHVNAPAPLRPPERKQIRTAQREYGGLLNLRYGLSGRT